ncbi:hypothetical protein ACEPAI_5869 [Sanghuangporus weigelae]
MENADNAHLNDIYVKHFQRHVEEAVSHLNGTHHLCGSLHPSHFPPCGYWSEEDKTRFFHALSVHSRFRPDLIAEDIPGKTTADVCVYLDSLDDAAAKTPKKFKRAALPRALEVSDSWIAFEENRARGLADLESTWETHQRNSRRGAELRSEKRHLLSEGVELSGDVAGKDNAKHIDTIFGELRARRETEWEKEDYIADLGTAHLEAIDNILRKAEETCTDPTIEDDSRQDGEYNNAISAETRNNSADNPITAPLTARATPLLALNSAGDDLNQPADANRNYISEVVILDPQLQTNNAEISFETDIHANTEGSLIGLVNLSPRSRRRHQKRLYMRRKRAAHSGKEVCMAVTRLKPGRKTNKKLLRELSQQKEQQGERDSSAAAGEEINLDDATFTSPIQEEQREELVDVFGGKEEIEITIGTEREDVLRQSGSLTTDELRARLADFHPHVGGLTLPYKVKEDLLALGFDSQTLGREGLGLFHLARLADLMSLYSSLQEAGPDIVTRLSGNLIKLLHAEVVHFITDLVHRCIAIHEQERLLKEHTKVWRLRGERIKVLTIHQALKTMGAATEKKGRFASLIDRLSSVNQGVERLDKGEETTYADRGETGSSENSNESADEYSTGGDSVINGDELSMDESEDEDQTTSIRKSEPLHRQIYAPFLWHASLDHLDPSPFVPGKASHTYDTSVDDDILDVLDASELVDELAEEQDLDSADVAAAEKAEKDLWAEFGLRERDEEITSEAKQLQEPAQTDDNTSPVQSPTPRKRRFGLRYGSSKRFKSSVYIEDSE